MKILFLSPSGQLGGAELSLLDVLASLRAEQPDWRLRLIASADGALVARAAQLGVETQVIPFPPSVARVGDAAGGSLAGLAGLVICLPWTWHYQHRLARAVRSFAPDILHTNGFKMHVLGALVHKGRSVVWHVRDFVSTRPIMARLLKYVANGRTAAVTNSHAVAVDFLRLLNSRVRAETIYNGIDLDEFTPEGSVVDLDALSGLPPATPGTLRVGLIATMAFWKGHETLIRAIALLPTQLNLRGYVIGGRIYQSSGSEQSVEKLHSLAADLGISQRLGFTGFLEHPAAAVRALDIVVHASTRPEPFGRVVVEAMGCGRPVITTATGGAAELITLGENALDFRPGDPQHLAQRILELAHDPNLRARLGAAGRETALKNFDRQRLGKQLTRFYQQVVGRVA